MNSEHGEGDTTLLNLLKKNVASQTKNIGKMEFLDTLIKNMFRFLFTFGLKVRKELISQLFLYIQIEYGIKISDYDADFESDEKMQKITHKKV